MTAPIPITAAELEARAAIYHAPIEADHAEGCMYLSAAGKKWVAPLGDVEAVGS